MKLDVEIILKFVTEAIITFDISSSSPLSSGFDGTRALNRLKTVFGSAPPPADPCQRLLPPYPSLFTKSPCCRLRSSCAVRFWETLYNKIIQLEGETGFKYSVCFQEHTLH